LSVVCVVLAAGISRRFGSNKLLRPIGGETLLQRAVRACGTFPVVVVASAENAATIDPQRTIIVVNEAPSLGMAHSLKLANDAIDASHAIAVLPADLAFIEPENVAFLVESAGDADVTYPRRRDGAPGHPVIFSAQARRAIAMLPNGDTIRTLRDRSDLSRRIVPVEEPWPYLDIDVRSDEKLVGRNR
jgi:molybdenum cofactor cytidylyltransferase